MKEPQKIKQLFKSFKTLYCREASPTFPFQQTIKCRHRVIAVGGFFRLTHKLSQFRTLDLNVNVFIGEATLAVNLIRSAFVRRTAYSSYIIVTLSSQLNSLNTGCIKSPVPLKNSTNICKNILLCLTLWHRHPLNLIRSESNQIQICTGFQAHQSQSWTMRLSGSSFSL